MIGHRKNSIGSRANPAARAGLWLLCLTLLSARWLLGETVCLQWNPNPETNLVGYIVCYGTATETNYLNVPLAPISFTNRFNGAVLTAPGTYLSNIQAGVTYFYFVLATNQDKLVSRPSEILLRTIPVPPTNATLTKP